LPKLKDGKKINVAILGGGVSSLTTAFYLKNSSVGDLMNITVYQIGWRLGGALTA
jgi:uncharacterized protein with NAD-binding domain and iron-sulfur cluster